MKVLVTGHNGYIGSVLVPMLLEAGYTVEGLDSNLFGDCTYGKPPVSIAEKCKDIRDVEISDIQGYDAVIHLAGLSNDPLGDYDPDLTYSINYRASVKIAELCKKAGVKRFLFASSCSNYGSAGDEFIAEGAEFNPVTPYGKSKVLVEQDVSKMADESFSPTFLRASTAYGMSPRIRFDLVANNLTAWAYTEGLVRLKSDGKPWRPLVHVEDIARAYISALSSPIEAVHNKGFNVGLTTENYRIREVAEIVRNIVPNCEIAFAENAGPDKRNYRVNCNYIALTLHNFKPQWTVERGVKQLYHAYKENGLKVEEFEGPKYKRIAHIQELIVSEKLSKDLRWLHK